MNLRHTKNGAIFGGHPVELCKIIRFACSMESHHADQV